MALNIMSTTDQQLDKLSVLIYGLPGAGKTRFIGSAARRFKTLIASAESGLLSLRDLRDADGNVIKADFAEVKKWEDMEEIVRFIMASNHDYNCFAVDSGTEIQQVCMDFILAQERRDKAQMQDWGTLNNKMVRMARYFRDLPKMNFIMTALSENLAEPDGTMKSYPYFQGKLQKTVAGYYDVVAHAFVHKVNAGTPEEREDHLLVCRSSEKLLTKDRSGKLSKIMKNDFCEMYSKVFDQQ